MQNPMGLSLVELLLSEQAELTAVDRFAQWHDDLDAETPPLQAEQYSRLIPVSAPAPGQQYAFRVDLDACTGCKACVTACHNLNGLDEGEIWRSVGAIVRDPEHEDRSSAFSLAESCGTESTLQTVTTACHHCEDPACLNGCPVKAYDKDPVTGIVKHLDDQCIGCRYCQLKCPYDVPSYSESRGIVRKCDMCSDRLAVDEAPACVQGCPNEAISIELVPARSANVPVKGADATGLLPLVVDGMPSSSITRPTTRYASEREGLMRPGWRSADHDRLEPAEAHDPLAIMLVLVQLSFGALVFSLLLPLFEAASATPQVAGAEGESLRTFAALRPYLAVFVLATAGLGQLAATAHLGRPLYAFRAFLGWRTSWMSREILSFGAYLGAVAAWVACELTLAFDAALGLPEFAITVASLARVPAAITAVATGAIGTLCSVMIYVDTQRAWWSLPHTLAKFLGTAVLLGPIGVAAVALTAAAFDPGLSGETILRSLVPGLAIYTVLAAFAKLGVEALQLRHAAARTTTTLRRSAMLLGGALRPLMVRRVWLGLVGGIGLPVLLLACASFGGEASLAIFPALPLAALGASFAIGGELIERHLFFRASASRAMPGE